jgi:transposase
VNLYAVDIAKADFQVEGPQGSTTVKNEGKDIRAWLKTTPKDAVIALESTGGYGMALAEIAHKSGRKVYVLAPRQIAAYRRALGRRAKTDRLDARLIRDFVFSNHERLHPFKPWDEPWKTLRDTVRLRNRLARDRARVSLRMRTFGVKASEIAMVLRGMDKYLRQLDKKIRDQLRDVKEAEAVSSPKGVGTLTAAAAIAALKQFPFKDGNAFVAHIGFDLVVNDSGKTKGRRSISSCGDATLRSLFFMAGRCAAGMPEWSDYVARLKARGMCPNQVHCAVARKLARIVFSLYHSGEMFDPAKAFSAASPNAPPRLASQA